MHAWNMSRLWLSGLSGTTSSSHTFMLVPGCRNRAVDACQGTMQTQTLSSTQCKDNTYSQQHVLLQHALVSSACTAGCCCLFHRQTGTAGPAGPAAP